MMRMTWRQQQQYAKLHTQSWHTSNLAAFHTLVHWDFLCHTKHLSVLTRIWTWRNHHHDIQICNIVHEESVEHTAQWDRPAPLHQLQRKRINHCNWWGKVATWECCRTCYCDTLRTPPAHICVAFNNLCLNQGYPISSLRTWNCSPLLKVINLDPNVIFFARWAREASLWREIWTIRLWWQNARQHVFKKFYCMMLMESNLIIVMPKHGCELTRLELRRTACTIRDNEQSSCRQRPAWSNNDTH